MGSIQASLSKYIARIIASGGTVFDSDNLGTGFGTYNFGLSRKLIRFGPNCSGISLRYVNWYAQASGNEVVGANNITVKAALELASMIPLTFGGKQSVTIEPGGEAWTDPLWGLDVAAASTAYAKTHVAVTLGEKYPTCNYWLGTSGDKAVQGASDMSAQLASTGALSVPGDGRSSPTGVAYGPAEITGIGDRSFVSVAVMGDSIAVGAGESNSAGDGNGNFGFIGRGLYAAGVAGNLAARTSEPGSNAVGLGGFRRRSLVRHASHVIDEYGTNDIAGAASLATVQASATSRWTSYKRMDKKVFAMKILPRVSGGGNSPIAGFTVGGVRDLYNTWLDTQIGGGLLDGTFDPNSVLEDPAAHGSWLATYLPGDGLHPTAAGHAAAASVVNSMALQFTL